MNINVKKKVMVRPAAETPRLRLWCSNLDLIARRLHPPLVYFYRSNGSSDFFNPVLLKEALSRALVPFYPLAGRLSTDKIDRIEIDCNAEGVLFVEANTTSVLDDLGDFAPSAKLKKLIPTVDYSAGLSSFPLFIVQITYFKCRGVSLGYGMFHTVGDGFTTIHFLNTWIDMVRGLSQTILPFIDRTLLKARQPTVPKFHHIEYQPISIVNTPSIFSPTTTKNDNNTITCSIFKFTKDQINFLKSSTKESGNLVNYTSFEILAGHIWRTVCKARGVDKNEKTILYLMTNGRYKLQPLLPQGYLGNVVFMTPSISLVGDLISNPSWFSTSIIHKSLEKMNDEYMRSAIDYLEIQSDLTPFVRDAHTSRSPNLVINSWAKFPLYDANFGWGNPFRAGPGPIAYDGVCYVLPSPKLDGNLYIAIGLQDEHVMKLFAQYIYDLKGFDSRL